MFTLPRNREVRRRSRHLLLAPLMCWLGQDLLLSRTVPPHSSKGRSDQDLRFSLGNLSGPLSQTMTGILPVLVLLQAGWARGALRRTRLPRLRFWPGFAILDVNDGGREGSTETLTTLTVKIEAMVCQQLLERFNRQTLTAFPDSSGSVHSQTLTHEHSVG